MAGLDPDRVYTVREIDKLSDVSLPFEGKSFTGKFLMENGLDIPSYPDNYMEKMRLQGYSSHVLVLEAR
jgi:alpha-galactosidase